MSRLEVGHAERARRQDELYELETLRHERAAAVGKEKERAAIDALAKAGAAAAAAARLSRWWLSRADYLALSVRSASTFVGDDSRNAVYDMFERCEIDSFIVC